MKKSVILKSIAAAVVLSKGIASGEHNEENTSQRFDFDPTNNGCELTNKRGVNVIKAGESDCGVHSGNCAKLNDSKQEGSWIEVSDKDTCEKISNAITNNSPDEIPDKYRKRLDESLFG